ncbi:hypothetical protein BGW41_001106 [Actinomortierella wolfii]|nr:hypothetical protein BGW41_001106 [Actinomortierella wolfii]
MPRPRLLQQSDQIIALDILPLSDSVDIPVNRPSTCSLQGKVRIITKRPCYFKSLVLTLTGSATVTRRQAKTIMGSQVFLHVTQPISTFTPPTGLASPTSPTAPTSPTSTMSRALPSPASSPVHQPMTDGIFDAHIHSSRTGTVSPPTSPHTIPSNHTEEHTPTNYLKEGLNDIFFTLSFPSHPHLPSDPQAAAALTRQEICGLSLPAGPIRTACGSVIEYRLQATLTMQKSFSLIGVVAGHHSPKTVSIPIHIQPWQDPIVPYPDSWSRRHRRRNRHLQYEEPDHTYHGKRRGKIHFHFQVPKQLDRGRLHDLQFSFQGSWKTLMDSVKVKEIEYYIVEEESQLYPGQIAGHFITTTIISSTAKYDCSHDPAPTNVWDHMRTDVRLHIIQPETVLDTTNLPHPSIFSVSHKLRAIFHFDKEHSNERDLQLSFPIRIHHTLDEDDAPSHLRIQHGLTLHEMLQSSMSRSRRRRYQQHLLALDPNSRSADPLAGLLPRRHAPGQTPAQGSTPAGGGDGDAAPEYDSLGDDDFEYEEDEDDDDDVAPLPMYHERQSSILLMSGMDILESAISETEDLRRNSRRLSVDQLDDQLALPPPYVTSAYSDAHTSAVASLSQSTAVPLTPPTSASSSEAVTMSSNGYEIEPSHHTRPISMMSISSNNAQQQERAQLQQSDMRMAIAITTGDDMSPMLSPPVSPLSLDMSTFSNSSENDVTSLSGTIGEVPMRLAEPVAAP